MEKAREPDIFCRQLVQCTKFALFAAGGGRGGTARENVSERAPPIATQITSAALQQGLDFPQNFASMQIRNDALKSHRSTGHDKEDRGRTRRGGK